VLALSLVLVVPDIVSAGWCQEYCQNSWPLILLSVLVGVGVGVGTDKGSQFHCY
jgi:hypothetical protein